jgi:hypothetical protein
VNDTLRIARVADDALSHAAYSTARRTLCLEEVEELGAAARFAELACAECSEVRDRILELLHVYRRDGRAAMLRRIVELAEERVGELAAV